MAIPQSFIETLKMSCDIESVISSYLPLRRQGRNKVGLCPFHSEKTPSMVVYDDSQSFYCFGCGAGGDVISFVMRAENLDYIEAVRFLAERAGIAMPEEAAEDPSTRLKPVILDINRRTARFYHEVLKSDAGEKGREYLLSRGLTMKTIVKYGLGFAPEGWNHLRDFLRKEGFTDRQMIEAAVVAKSRNDSCYDMFRNRVIFPIIDLRKNVIGFGGRVMDDSKPKYLNSADTLVFKKSRNLFSMNFAKTSCGEKLILAEGYMDVISVNQAGFENVVATLGTALTPEQCRLIASYTKQVVIAYDSDGAGRTATNRAVELLRETGVETRILNMSGAKDPDEYIKKFGPQRFKMLVDGASGVTEYQLSTIRKKYDLNTPDGKTSYLREATRYVASLPNPIEREIYGGVLAGETGVNRETVLSNIQLAVKKNRRADKKREWEQLQNDREVFRDRINPQRGSNLNAALAEETILAFLFKHQDYLDYISTKLSKESFVTEYNREVFGIMAQKIQNNNNVTLTDFYPELNQEQIAKFSGILARMNEIDLTVKALDDCIAVLIEQSYKNISGKVGSMSDDEIQKAAEMLKKKKSDPGKR